MTIEEREHEKRQKTVQNHLKECGAYAAIVSNKTNLYYLLGQIVEGYLFVPAEGEVVLFVKRPSSLFIKSAKIVPIRKPENMMLQLEGTIPHQSLLLLEFDDLTYNEYLRLSALFPNQRLQNLTPLLREVRSIKSEYEIELFRRSAKKQADVYASIPSYFREGMSDNDLFYEVEYNMRKAGHLGLFKIFGKSMEQFMGCILTGDNAAAPSPYDFALGGAGMHPSTPGGSNGTLLKEGMTVMVDISGNFYGYQSDMSRAFAIGRLPDIAYEAHNLCLQIDREVAQAIRPGITTGGELYDIAISRVQASGFAPYFMGITQKAGFIGHGIGLEINELPLLAPRQKKPFLPGMVFALEPKIVLPGIGPVGVENSYAVTETSVEKLTILTEDLVNLIN